MKHPLIISVLVISAVLAVLSYLFHPDIGVLQLNINGKQVSDPFIRMAAIPSAIVVMLLVGLLSVLLFMGIGLFIFFIALFFALLGVFFITPSFWPILVLVFLLMLLLSSGQQKN
ncbi:MAG: hypothetical protein WC782_09865 [Methylococcaceae bacterium]|jgi:hypothetical protein